MMDRSSQRSLMEQKMPIAKIIDAEHHTCTTQQGLRRNLLYLRRIQAGTTWCQRCKAVTRVLATPPLRGSALAASIHC
jgi:hypothetical protein